MHVLFCGLGGVGQRHLRNLSARFGSKLEVSAYRVRGELDIIDDQLHVEPGENVEQRFAIRVYDDLDRALEAHPTLTVIANPTSAHVPTALRCATAGSDLWIEKPLAHNLDGVERLLEVARKNELFVFVSYQLRFHPAFIALKNALQSNTLGSVYGAEAEISEYLPGFHPYEDYRRMYASRAELGGGVTLTQIHELDLICQLWGLPHRVFSVGSHVSDLEIDVEDTASSLLDYGTEVPFCVRVHQDFLGQPPRRRLTVHGAQGRLELDLRLGTLVRMDHGGATTVLADASSLPRNDLFISAMNHVLSCIDRRTDLTTSLEDGVTSLKLALALRESQKSQQSIEVDPARAPKTQRFATFGGLR